MPKARFDPAIREALDAMLLPDPRVSPGSMFGYPAYFTGGKMFACAYGDGVGLKVSAARAEALVGTDGIEPFVPMGRRRMKEWIMIGRVDRKIVGEALRYVASLKA